MGSNVQTHFCSNAEVNSMGQNMNSWSGHQSKEDVASCSTPSRRQLLNSKLQLVLESTGEPFVSDALGKQAVSVDQAQLGSFYQLYFVIVRTEANKRGELRAAWAAICLGAHRNECLNLVVIRSLWRLRCSAVVALPHSTWSSRADNHPKGWTVFIKSDAFCSCCMLSYE